MYNSSKVTYRYVHQLTCFNKIHLLPLQILSIELILVKQASQIMKYILQSIWNFIKQIPNKVNKIIQQKITKKTEIKTSIPRLVYSYKPKRRKRQSFRSFLREEQQSRIRRRRLLKERRKFKKSNCLHKNGQISSIQMSVEYQNSQYQNKECFTNQLQPPSFSLFQDNNGLQISVITPANKAFEEPPKIDDSDEELLQLFTGTKRRGKEIICPVAPAQIKQLAIQQRIRTDKDYRQWWRIAAEIDNFPIFPQNWRPESDPVIGEVKLQRRQSHLKIVIFIDLVVDQDCPKLFQVPLAISQL